MNSIDYFREMHIFKFSSSGRGAEKEIAAAAERGLFSLPKSKLQRCGRGEGGRRRRRRRRRELHNGRCCSYTLNTRLVGRSVGRLQRWLVGLLAFGQKVPLSLQITMEGGRKEKGEGERGRERERPIIFARGLRRNRKRTNHARWSERSANAMKSAADKHGWLVGLLPPLAIVRQNLKCEREGGSERERERGMAGAPLDSYWTGVVNHNYGS